MLIRVVESIYYINYFFFFSFFFCFYQCLGVNQIGLSTKHFSNSHVLLFFGNGMKKKNKTKSQSYLWIRVYITSFLSLRCSHIFAKKICSIIAFVKRVMKHYLPFFTQTVTDALEIVAYTWEGEKQWLINIIPQLVPSQAIFKPCKSHEFQNY